MYIVANMVKRRVEEHVLLLITSTAVLLQLLMASYGFCKAIR